MQDDRMALQCVVMQKARGSGIVEEQLPRGGDLGSLLGTVYLPSLPRYPHTVPTWYAIIVMADSLLAVQLYTIY